MTEVRTPNLPELKRLNMWVQEQDKLEPGARIWDQESWAATREESPMCQTAYCVAGMTITRAGHSLANEIFTVVDEEFGNWEDERMLLDGIEVGSWDISRRAADILGIDYDTANFLFAAINTAGRIDEYIRHIFEKAHADYEATEPAPNFEIEIKAEEAAQQHLKFTNIKEEASV